MCTYNGSKFVGEQLESIAKQTRLPAELIVIDDRSTDVDGRDRSGVREDRTVRGADPCE